LHTLWNGIAALGSGDLTVKMGLTAMDEIGEIARTLDKTVSSLHQLVRNIQDAAKQTSHSSEQLAASSRSISVGAQRQASAIEEIGQSIDVMSSSIQATAYKAEEATHVSDGTARIATKGNETVKQSVVAMSRINESSMQIGKIVSIISQISDQTNMLSINAAIEAAIAEQHGVCFAVVADEVGKLAERSSQATKEIAQLIDISKNRVSEGSCLSEKVGTALSEIIQGIERAAVGIADISTSTKQQTSTVINVSQSAENISSITEANCKEATEMAVRANELSEQAQHLQALTDMFKLDRV
jgi:methyl-accepting chemotaxis protein